MALIRPIPSKAAEATTWAMDKVYSAQASTIATYVPAPTSKTLYSFGVSAVLALNLLASRIDITETTSDYLYLYADGTTAPTATGTNIDVSNVIAIFRNNPTTGGNQDQLAYANLVLK